MKNWVGLSKSSNINKVDLVDTGLMLGHKVSNFKESDHTDHILRS